MISPIKNFIEQKDLDGLRLYLGSNPKLVNEGITIPFDKVCMIKAHPLHRICDAVFAHKITDTEAVLLAQIFLDHGAHVDGDKDKGAGTPIIAAASLRAELVGILYIDHGADIHYTYQNDGVTPLHWASFCGLDRLVNRLIEAGALVDLSDKNYQSTPLSWALHSMEMNDPKKVYNQLACIQILLRHGADINRLSPLKIDYLNQIAQDHSELKALL